MTKRLLCHVDIVQRSMPTTGIQKKILTKGLFGQKSYSNFMSENFSLTIAFSVSLYGIESLSQTIPLSTACLAENLKYRWCLSRHPVFVVGLNLWEAALVSDRALDMLSQLDIRTTCSFQVPL